MADLTLAALILGCAAGTYAWRGLGVWVAHRIDVDSDWFRWLTCIAYALIAGLISRVVLLPVGDLAQTLLWHRLLGVALAVLAFRLFRRNQLIGVLVGASSLPLLGRFG